MNTITVLIAEDDLLKRQGPRSLLRLEKDITVAGEVSHGIEVLTAVGKMKPQVLLMELELPELYWRLALPLISERSPDTKVLMVAASFDEERFYRALQAGAKGYVGSIFKKLKVKGRLQVALHAFREDASRVTQRPRGRR